PPARRPRAGPAATVTSASVTPRPPRSRAGSRATPTRGDSTGDPAPSRRRGEPHGRSGAGASPRSRRHVLPVVLMLVEILEQQVGERVGDRLAVLVAQHALRRAFDVHLGLAARSAFRLA